jgi:protein-S-isoprenylcysteine O-methyltransferase Ste14
MNAGWVWKAALFALATAGALQRSRHSLANPHSYGFHRFFAFETIFLLLIWNSDVWWHRPFSAPQLISWILLLGSAALAVSGFLALHRHGRPEGTIDRTTEVVTQGVYRWVRHPLYGSLILFVWGASLKRISLWSFALAGLATVLLVATALLEEGETRRRLGEAYDHYARRTRRFLPGLF